MIVLRRPGAFVQRLRAHIPRQTVRTRLTILYSSVFLLCGAVLLAITYLLVDHSSNIAEYSSGTADPASKRTFFQHTFSNVANAHPVGNLPSPSRVEGLISRVQANELHQLLVKSGIALALMAIAAAALGYLVASRTLRPLRSITATARGISAANLHERLAMAGPDDELKELGDTFDELLARLEASFVTQRQFVANASHELRSPLTRIRVLAEVAATDQDATIGSLQAAHHRVVAASQQQEQLIEALLTLAKGHGGVADRESIDLAVLVENALSAFRHGPDDLQVQIETTFGPATVSGDRRLVERLVANLIDNAVRYNIPGGRVRVTTGTDEHGACLDVSNDGQAIPPTELDRLFQPFQRLEAGRFQHRNGHGLGLSIVESIADAHDAIVMAYPRAEGGLQIKVRFSIAGSDLQRGRMASLNAQANHSIEDRS